MSIDLASLLLHSGRSHAEAACLLYRAAFELAGDEEIENPDAFAFNGPYSMSVQYLLGLGLELMVKSAVVAWDPAVDGKWLQEHVRHDLVQALDEAEQRGFATQDPNLRRLLEILRDPYKQHWLRYERPNQFELPDNFDQIVPVLEALHSEVNAKIEGLKIAGG